MENETNKQEVQHSTTTKKRFWGGYIVAGLIWTLAQSFKKSTIDELIILVIAIVAGFLYYRLKSKIKVKNEAAKIIITFVILYIVSAFLVGFLTALANNWEAVAVRTPLGTDIAQKDGEILTQLNHDLQMYLNSFQGQWDSAQNNIDEKINSRVAYSTNISSYRNLEKLNNERYERFVSYSEQVKSILSKYSSNLMDAFSQMVTAAENTKNAYNDVFEAKINYYQALLDGQSETEINNKLSAANDAVNRFNKEQQTAAQAQSNWQKAYSDFFGG